MSAVECPREADIAESIRSGLWSNLSGQALQDHVKTCEICRDLVAVMQAMREGHRDTCRQASIPSARVVWWRAHVRARVEAAETVTQPIAWLNGITTVSIIAVAVAVMSAAFQLFPRSISLGTSLGRLFDISTATRSAANSLAIVSMMVLDSTVAVWGLVACLLLAPFAVYWMLAGDR